MEYPTILGSPAAGVVESIGAGVRKIAIGEKVVCGTKVLVHKEAKYGGFKSIT